MKNVLLKIKTSIVSRGENNFIEHVYMANVTFKNKQFVEFIKNMLPNIWNILKIL